MDFHFESFPEFFRLCFKVLFTHFHDFGHAETGSGAKKRALLLREIFKFFRSNFDVVHNHFIWCSKINYYTMYLFNVVLNLEVRIIKSF